MRRDLDETAVLRAQTLDFGGVHEQKAGIAARGPMKMSPPRPASLLVRSHPPRSCPRTVANLRSPGAWLLSLSASRQSGRRSAATFGAPPLTAQASDGRSTRLPDGPSRRRHG